jgi:hypothetical protein
VTTQWQQGIRASVPADYQVLDCSLRVSRLIAGLTTVHGDWLGLRPKPWQAST